MKLIKIISSILLSYLIASCGAQGPELELKRKSVSAEEPQTFADAFQSKQTKLRYLNIGASYTYGVGANGNSFAPGGDFDYLPGSGGAYTSMIANKAEDLDIFNLFDIDNLNVSVPGQTSGQILGTQLTAGVNYIKNAPEGAWTLAEVAMGGNDLLGFLLFPRQLPSSLTSNCFDVTPSEGRFGNHFNLNSGPACDAVISQILAGAEANLDAYVKELKKVANWRTFIIVRNFPNPTLSVPAEYGGATCESVIASQDLYGVSLKNADVDRFLNGRQAKDGIDGLNTIISKVAAANGLRVADIRGSVSDGKVFADCIHPNQEGHRVIAKRIVKTVIGK